MFNRILQGIISLGAALAAFSILGTGMYYVMPVTTLGLLVCAVVGSAVGYKVGSAWVDPEPVLTTLQRTNNRTCITTFIPLLLSLFSLTLWWHAVLTHPVLASVRSPWLVVSPTNLIWLFIPAVCVVVMLTGRKEGDASVAPSTFGVMVLTLFSALSFVAAAYPLGFGFDPFLHRATIQHIAEYGTITPKPLYYIGEYVIELFAMKALHLPLMLVDVYLVPLLAATLIPAAVYIRAVRAGGARPAPTAAILLFLPIAAFIQTTPQALAFVFTAVAVLIGSTRPTTSPPPPPSKGGGDALAAVFAVAALCAHPIAGLLAVFFVAMTYVSTLRGKNGRVKTAAFAGVVALATIALPSAFIVQSIKAHLPLGLHLPSLRDISTLPLSVFAETHFNAWGDTAYLVIGNMFIVTVILGVIGMWRMRKEAGQASPIRRYVPLVCAGIAFSNFLILGLLFDFPFLISYERTDFAARMLTLTALFLLPYIPYAFAGRVDGGVDPYRARRAFAIGIIGIIFVSTVYGAFPRHDAYARSAAFNVTQADFDAVAAIENYAAGREYVVLANQATSSAAITQLGFKKYYHGDIYFYPIPTGGPLYQLYLDMAKSPTESTIDKARALTGAQLVFFVMDDYWWDSKRVIEQTKTITDTSWTFGDHDVTVMVFE